MERQTTAEYGDGGRDLRSERAATTMEFGPDALRGLGLSANPRPGESFELAGRALCRGMSQRGGAVMQVEVAAMRPASPRGRGEDARRGAPSGPSDAGMSDPSGMEARKAFFRSLFSEDD